MNKTLAGVATAVVALGLPMLASAADFKLDPSHSNASFKVRHMMVSTVRGEFADVQGTVKYDAKAPEKIVIEAVIAANSINTRNEKRDDHLKSADFFDVAKHPALTFKSKSAKKNGKKLAVKGDLTIRGVTKEVTLDVEGLDTEMKDPWGNTLLGASATTQIDRKDFGLNWNQALEAGGVLVGEKIDITLDVELVKQAAPATAEN